ncbi:MAG TPA: GNAT family N-acetyltransferase [Sedimentisphaerales bacterium]|nr:GNAT family N-acetyltransferase [Sedimentisphaerales bacterium]
MNVSGQAMRISTQKGWPLATNRALRMVCYQSFEEAEFLRERWDALVERLDGDLYSSFDWCATWWKHFGRGRQLAIYVATVHDELAAVLPLFRETIRWGPLSLKVVRIVGCDHLTTTCNVAVGPEWVVQVAEGLMTELCHDGKWDLIHMGSLPGYSQCTKALADAIRCCRQAGKVVFGDNDYPHMVFELPGSFEEFVESLSTKERRNVRRDERQLESVGAVRQHQPASVCDVEQALDRLSKLHTAYWVGRGRLGHFHEWPGVEAFHRDVAERLFRRGRLALVEVSVDGETVASEYGGWFGPRMHWVIGARGRDLTSRIGFCALVRAVLASGRRQIESTPGYYDYKRRLGAKVLGVQSIWVFSHGVMSRARARIFWAVTWVIGQAYHRVWFWHLAPWLRRKFPGLWLPWLRAGLWPRFLRANFLIAARRRSAGLTSTAETP